ncbi:MAG: hypothetical protein KF716_22245 [Anaerolineae bacterium]|nr:hypothetical protein [Anaerolineae bacterium]
MPTPFMHMALAHRMNTDAVVPSDIRSAIQADWGAFLLGQVAPDARVSSGLQRPQTHFFDYQPIIDPPAPQVMLTKHPELRRPRTTDPSQAAFVAGYVAHLVVDEVWCMEALYPLFSEWGTMPMRFHMLHMLLGFLDERDYTTLPSSDYAPMHNAAPDHWLPFMTDADLIVWRDLIADQLPSVGRNLTYDILSKRIDQTPEQMADFVHNTQEMQTQLWSNVPPDKIAHVEQDMYARSRQTVIDYYTDTI